MEPRDKKLFNELILPKLIERFTEMGAELDSKPSSTTEPSMDIKTSKTLVTQTARAPKVK